MAKELDLTIDEHRLDKEWLNQPNLAHEWAKNVADAQYAYDEAKAKLDLVSAELDQEIRANPEHFDLSKPTESSIKNTIITQPEFQTATKAVNRSRHELQIAQAAMSAIEHRKRALSLLVELWIRDYYSNPSPKPETEKGEEFEKRLIRRRARKRTEESDDDE